MGEFNVETIICDESGSFQMKDRAFNESIFNFRVNNSSISLNEVINRLVEEARKKLSKTVKYGIENFLCDICGDVMTEPVTLRCGHTFSKKCVLAGNGSFECKLCGHVHRNSPLKTNVIIASFVDTFWRFLENKKYEATKESCDENFYLSSCTRTQEMFSGIAHLTTPKNFYKRGDMLAELGEIEDAIMSYIIFSVFNPRASYSTEKASQYIRSIWLQSSQRPIRETVKSCAFEVMIPQVNGLAKNSNQIEMNQCAFSINDSANGKLYIKNCDLWSTIERKDNILKGILSALIKNIEKFVDFISLVCKEFHCDFYEFDCPLCFRILWEPCTTPCGHTFCTDCLNRSLDHQPKCPLCKASLEKFLTERSFKTTVFIENAIKHLFPNHYIEREINYKEEINTFQNTMGGEHYIPLFICTMAYPTVPCALHIFEPCYRLMIRRCMESGHRRFGMCSYVDNDIAGYGTMLEIRDVHYFPDGRSIVDTIGSKRFRILSKGEKDGYHTAAVEFLEDQKIAFENLDDVKIIHQQAYKISCDWIRRLSKSTRQQILQYFGPMPEIKDISNFTCDGPSWFWWMLAVLPFKPEAQVMLLGMCNVYLRLSTLYRILLRILSSKGIKNI